MSVLLEFAMFPTDKGTSVSKDVSKIIAMIRESGIPYKLTPMGTIIETEEMPEALDIIQKSYDLLKDDSKRIYATLTFDIQKGKNKRLISKVQSIEDKIGKVEK
ncbi:MAG: MTH1187 family thiamine-binding protein [Bacteroidales bacterium]|nr:MTH1187 family thiamine-binding protein [Bacteroidales bacterium]